MYSLPAPEARSPKSRYSHIGAPSEGSMETSVLIFPNSWRLPAHLSLWLRHPITVSIITWSRPPCVSVFLPLLLRIQSLESGATLTQYGASQVALVVNLPANAGDKRIGSSWVRKIPWRRKWQPTPLLLPGESHEQRSQEGHSP